MKKQGKKDAGAKAQPIAEKKHAEIVRPIDPKVLDKAADLELKRRDADFDLGKEAHGD